MLKPASCVSISSDSCRGVGAYIERTSRGQSGLVGGVGGWWERKRPEMQRSASSSAKRAYAAQTHRIRARTHADTCWGGEKRGRQATLRAPNGPWGGRHTRQRGAQPPVRALEAGVRGA